MNFYKILQVALLLVMSWNADSGFQLIATLIIIEWVI